MNGDTFDLAVVTNAIADAMQTFLTPYSVTCFHHDAIPTSLLGAQMPSIVPMVQRKTQIHVEEETLQGTSYWVRATLDYTLLVSEYNLDDTPHNMALATGIITDLIQGLTTAGATVGTVGTSSATAITILGARFGNLGPIQYIDGKAAIGGHFLIDIM